MASAPKPSTVPSVENDSREPSREGSSDEDTEDASEPEHVRMESENSAKNGSCEEKVAALREQLRLLEEGTDPEYLKKVKAVEEIRQKRLFVTEVFRDYELQCVDEELQREKAIAMQEFEAKKLELKDCLLNDLHEKKKAYETYKHSLELGSGVDSFEPKTMTTRKLRRRHYDPMPLPEKRRKCAPYIEVEEDMKVIFKGKVSTTPKALSSPVPVASNDGGNIYEARIEDGKLFYENRWFHKGQHIFIESKEHGQESGVITSITQSEIWVKRLPDNSKLRIYVSQLTKGKYVLKRRSA